MHSNRKMPGIATDEIKQQFCSTNAAIELQLAIARDDALIAVDKNNPSRSSSAALEKQRTGDEAQNNAAAVELYSEDLEAIPTKPNDNLAKDFPLEKKHTIQSLGC